MARKLIESQLALHTTGVLDIIISYVGNIQTDTLKIGKASYPIYELPTPTNVITFYRIDSSGEVYTITDDEKYTYIQPLHGEYMFTVPLDTSACMQNGKLITLHEDDKNPERCIVKATCPDMRIITHPIKIIPGHSYELYTGHTNNITGVEDVDATQTFPSYILIDGVPQEHDQRHSYGTNLLRVKNAVYKVHSFRDAGEFVVEATNLLATDVVARISIKCDFSITQVGYVLLLLNGKKSYVVVPYADLVQQLSQRI